MGEGQAKGEWEGASNRGQRPGASNRGQGQARGGGGEGSVATWVADQGNAFQHADGSDNERKVGRNLEGEVECDLGQVSSKIPANTHSTALNTPQQTGQHIQQQMNTLQQRHHAVGQPPHVVRHGLLPGAPSARHAQPPIPGAAELKIHELQCDAHDCRSEKCCSSHTILQRIIVQYTLSHSTCTATWNCNAQFRGRCLCNTPDETADDSQQLPDMT